jgi:hypothetical protein
MKQSTLSTVLIVLLIIGSVSGYLVGYYVPRTSSSNTFSAVSTSVGCTVSDTTEGVVIQLVEYNYTASGQNVVPIPGATIIGQDVGYCNDQRQVMNLSKATTNSTGWASLLNGGFGVYYLTIDFFPSGEQSPFSVFNVSVITQLTAITEATFNLSSGNLTTHFIYLA